MRHHLSFFSRSLIAAAPLVLTFGSIAHARPSKVMESARTRVTVPVAVGDIATQKPINLAVAGERYRLWFSINATDCNDPALLGNGGKDDHSFELYGELRVNDKVEWKVARMNNGAAQPGLKHLDLPSSSKVDARKQGFLLNSNPSVFGNKHEINVETSKSRSAHISLQLFDKDDPLAGYDFDRRDQAKADHKDDQIGDYNIDLDLGALGTGDGSYYWFWNGHDESGNPIGTNLYLHAEHVGTVYESVPSGLIKPQVGPQVNMKKPPGNTGSSGPIIDRPNRRKPRPKKVTPEAPPTPPAKGRNVKITARFVVTNSEDGAGDNVVELLGSIYINGVQVFSFNKDKAEVGKEFYSRRAVAGGYYYQGSGSFTVVRGVVEDHDKGSGNDTMWVANQKINLQQILDSHNEFLIKGDRDSESGDLYIRVEALGEFY